MIIPGSTAFKQVVELDRSTFVHLYEHYRIWHTNASPQMLEILIHLLWPILRSLQTPLAAQSRAGPKSMSKELGQVSERILST